MTVKRFRLEVVELVPRPLEEGVLYFSPKYETAIHLCACGCGIETVTPLSENGWELTVEYGNATLVPSIGNMRFPCGSHYWIREGHVRWAADNGPAPVGPLDGGEE